MTVCYARVSSHDQKEQLGTQAQRLAQYCTQQGWRHCRTLKDLGSGMNYNKPGLKKLLQLLLTGRAQRFVLVTKIKKLTAKLKQLEKKLDESTKRLKANVPGICFGSRKLFMKQYQLQANGFKDHAEWLCCTKF